MASNAPQGKSWKEHNRLHKEKRKKWREERILKKAKLEEPEEKPEIPPEEPERPPLSTLSIAVPGSIVDNAQSLELQTYLAGQIARAACIYKVDEVIVFDDKGEMTEKERKECKKDNLFGEVRKGCAILARILQYMECPQYLRRKFIPMHKSLERVGVLNPLDAPHHLRAHDVSLFREGIVTEKPIKAGHGSQVNVGLMQVDVHIDKVLTPDLRVTVRIPPEQENPKRIKGTVVSSKTPRQEKGIYWGYTVRIAKSLNEVFNSPEHQKYDLTIGTSDKGSPIDEVPAKSLNYNHAIIVFGGLAGIEAAIEADPVLNVDDPSILFDKYLNTCPEQGSRTIRTEEAILISLAELRTKLNPENPAMSSPQFPSNDKEQSGVVNGKENGTEVFEGRNGKKCGVWGLDSGGEGTSKGKSKKNGVFEGKNGKKGRVYCSDSDEDETSQKNGVFGGKNGMKARVYCSDSSEEETSQKNEVFEGKNGMKARVYCSDSSEEETSQKNGVFDAKNGKKGRVYSLHSSEEPSKKKIKKEEVSDDENEQKPQVYRLDSIEGEPSKKKSKKKEVSDDKTEQKPQFSRLDSIEGEPSKKKSKKKGVFGVKNEEKARVYCSDSSEEETSQKNEVYNAKNGKKAKVLCLDSIEGEPSKKKSKKKEVSDDKNEQKPQVYHLDSTEGEPSKKKSKKKGISDAKNEQKPRVYCSDSDEEETSQKDEFSDAKNGKKAKVYCLDSSEAGPSKKKSKKKFKKGK